MDRVRLIIYIVAFAFLFAGCHKDNRASSECNNLKEGIQANDKDRVTTAVNHLLMTYSKDNLEKFAASISSECNITAVLLCYDCVQTNPPESEMKVSFIFSNIPVDKVLDLSYDGNNRMIITGIHN
jgi:hypothetical protein